MEKHGFGLRQLARRLDVDPMRVARIEKGTLGVTADTALRLGRLFRTGAWYWLDLQARHDLEQATRQHGAEIERAIEPVPEDGAD